MKALIATLLLALSLMVTIPATSPAASAPSVTPTSITTTTQISRNFDNGGGQVPIGSYIARVYIYYNGYWHWLNCQWIVYPWGAFMDHCW